MGEAVISLFIKASKNIFSYVFQYDNNSAYTLSFNIFNPNRNDQDFPYNMCCNTTAMLKIDSAYKQSKKYHPQVYVEECKYADAEIQQCIMLNDSDDDEGFFEVA